MVLVAACAWMSTRAAAEVEMPRRSPRARVLQQVGLTEITVDYDSPAVRGRALWGSSIPYDEVWRRGEIPAPKITFTRNVALGDAVVPAGTYALLLVPSRADWTIILNKRANVMEAEREPKAELDVVRFKAHAAPVPFRERLTFLFSDFTNDRVVLEMEWEKVRVSIPIRVFTTEQIVADIKALDGVGRQYANAARYMLETKKDYRAGLKYIDKSIALGEDWYNVWIKASLLAALGNYEDARAEADRSYDMGLKVGEAFFLEPEVRRALQDWNHAATKQAAAAAKRRPVVALTAAPSAPAPQNDPPAPPVIAIVTERPDPAHAPAQPASTTTAPGAGLAERPVAVHHAAGPTLSKSSATTDISPVLKKGRADLQSCYQRALRLDPELTRGRINVSLTVAASGRASNIALETPERLRALEPCLKEAISRWAFPESSAEYGVEFPVVLQGKED
jgi:hypothetical protein